jgi:hypothetical protein
VTEDPLDIGDRRVRVVGESLTDDGAKATNDVDGDLQTTVANLTDELRPVFV